MVNASENTLCSIFKINVSQLMIQTRESFEIAKQVIYEVSDVARAKGINISREKALEHVMKVTRSVPEHVPSMVLDIINKKKTEISSLNEAVVKEGKELGIPTPINGMIVNIIRTIEKNYDKTID
jgi:2-dehydropantoate 2-reductase